MTIDDSDVVRVNEDALEFDGDLRCLDGSPFSGLGIDYYPSGAIRAETPYKDGFESGVVREWTEAGILHSECSSRRGLKYGKSRTWHTNGSLKIDAEYEWGVELEYIEFDEKGIEIVRRSIDKESPNSPYLILQKFRKIYSHYQ